MIWLLKIFRGWLLGSHKCRKLGLTWLNPSMNKYFETWHHNWQSHATSDQFRKTFPGFFPHRIIIKIILFLCKIYENNLKRSTLNQRLLLLPHFSPWADSKVLHVSQKIWSSYLTYLYLFIPIIIVQLLTKFQFICLVKGAWLKMMQQFQIPSDLLWACGSKSFLHRHRQPIHEPSSWAVQKKEIYQKIIMLWQWL